MGKTLTRNDILNLARLARLRLSEAEIEQYLKELDVILAYVEQLSAVDTEGLAPTTQVTGLVNVMRPDSVEVQLASPDALMRIVPKTQNGYIKVNRMI